jgi:glycosyltransferase involved in cell wall biosynthesis
MAALDEAGAVGDVVAALPPEVCDLATECIVVDDGSADSTASEAAGAGALVCRFESNLGQGLALRAAYRLASGRGARIIVTMDADGQFDPAELERLVAPLVAGSCDMVNGSRRLGQSDNPDRVRAAGVLFFGGLISLLTGVRITDPANGFRAFLPEVVERVPLRQAQYQTSELLIGALTLGYRVVEVPVTVRPRASGQTKKGRNLVYGYRFGRVVLCTWWSLRRAARAQPHP